MEHRLQELDCTGSNTPRSPPRSPTSLALDPAVMETETCLPSRACEKPSSEPGIWSSPHLITYTNIGLDTQFIFQFHYHRTWWLNFRLNTGLPGWIIQRVGGRRASPGALSENSEHFGPHRGHGRRTLGSRGLSGNPDWNFTGGCLTPLPTSSFWWWGHRDNSLLFLPSSLPAFLPASRKRSNGSGLPALLPGPEEWWGGILVSSRLTAQACGEQLIFMSKRVEEQAGSSLSYSPPLGADIPSGWDLRAASVCYPRLVCWLMNSQSSPLDSKMNLNFTLEDSESLVWMPPQGSLQSSPVRDSISFWC